MKYRRNNRINVSNKFKQSCKDSSNPLKYAKIHIIEDNIDIFDNDYIVDFQIEGNCYKDSTFIGATACKKITVNLLSDSSINLENKTVQVYTGISNGTEIEYILLGTFIIDKPTTEEVTQKTSFTGYDYLIKFNDKYEDNNTYPISLYDYVLNLCSQVGIELDNTSIVNGNYMVIGNPFKNNETKKTVLEQVCQLCGGFAKITTENKLKIVNLVENEKLDTLDGDIYNSFSKNKKYGKINSVTLSLSGIVGENTNLKDQASIDENGLTEVVISDNYFLNSQTEREKVIQELFNVLNGISYVPYEMEYYGFPYLEIGDGIEILDVDDTSYLTYIFDYTFKYNGGYSGILKNKTVSEVQSKVETSKQKFKRIERTVDKINGEIVDIIETQDDFSSQLVLTKQDIDGIKQQVEDMTDFIREVNSKGEICLTKTSNVLGTILTLELYGDMNYVYPSEITYPSNTLYPVGQYITLVVDKQPKGNISNEALATRIELAEPLRKYDDSTYDEILIEDDTCVLIRRCGLNESGEVYVLDNPTKATIGEMLIPSFENNTYIYVLEQPNLTIYSKYLIDNDYINTFALKVDVASQIEQNKDSIMSTVEANYETKENAQKEYTKIKQTTDNITTEVNKKVGEDEFGTKIEQNSNAVKYAWNQISQYLQLELIDNKICLAIRDTNNKLLMTINQDGQHFYCQNKNMVETVAMPSSSFPTLFFNVDGDNVVNNKGVYDTALGFSVSMTSSQDNKKYYYPMFYWGKTLSNQKQGVHLVEPLIFDDGDYSSSESPYIDKNNGGLVYLIKEGSDVMVKTLNGKVVAILGQGTLQLLDNNQSVAIELFVNTTGTYTLNFENGEFFASHVYASNQLKNTDIDTLYFDSENLSVTNRDGNLGVFNPAWTSDARLKENIETSNKNSLDLINSIQHYAFDWKKDKKHEDIGYIAQELEKIDENLIKKYPIEDENNNIIDYHYTINERYIISNLTKALQQQQEQIDYLYKQLNFKKKKSKINKEKLNIDYGQRINTKPKYDKLKKDISKLLKKEENKE